MLKGVAEPARQARIELLAHERSLAAMVERAYGLTDEEVEAGYILTCQSIPVGDGVAVDYDA